MLKLFKLQIEKLQRITFVLYIPRCPSLQSGFYQLDHAWMIVT